MIEGYGIQVDYDGHTLRVHPRNKMFATALAGEDRDQGDVVISREEMADVRFKDASRLTNGNLTIRTAEGQKYQLHFRRKHRDDFRQLAEQLGTA